jgi:hypothetical protein
MLSSAEENLAATSSRGYGTMMIAATSKQAIMLLILTAAHLLLMVVGASAPVHAQSEGKPVTLIKDGVARMPVIKGSVEEPVAELRHYLRQMTGTTLDVASAGQGKAGIYVGLVKDFPWFKVDRADELGPEGFVLQSDGTSLYLVAAKPRGVQHAVSTLLQRLGCRWYFPGEAWQIIPRRKTIAGQWHERHTPAFPTQRRIWYGYGAYPAGKRDLEEWERHNRMGGPIEVSIGHTWHGLNPDRDFAKHPDWFALVDGKRQPTKPCYSHPQVLERAIQSALKQAGQGKGMISMTPPDGLGYCECERCLAVFAGGKPFRSHSTLFARRPDGALVNITSETLFAFVNQVAAAVAKKYSQTLIGCYAYSAYSHPPSFKLHPNVYLQTTTAFRRTPITLQEQITAFGKKTKQVGIREYYSVYQWDWDYPDPGKMAPNRLVEDLKFYHRNGITAVNAEASNNWAARGLGYYVASQLMWDVDVDVKEIVRDFYQQAFGPAAGAMQRYYARWYGPDVAVLKDERALPKPCVLYEKGKFDVDALKAAYRDLDEAVRLVPVDSGYRQRIDLLRMYAHYLFLRYRLYQAEQAHDDRHILDAIKAETIFAGQLTNTNMIHSRPLIGKAFLRRFRTHQALLAGVEEAQQAGKGWRQIGDPPTRKQLEMLWSADKAELGLR